MKTPDYHNPQNVPESAINKSLGERFLLREEVGTDAIKSKCNAWMVGSKKWDTLNWNGEDLSSTYKTTLPLPPEYREAEGYHYLKEGEQVIPFITQVLPVSSDEDIWSTMQGSFIIGKADLEVAIYRNPIEIDWKTPEKQAEVRRMWADNPAMEREVWDGNAWVSIEKAFGSYSETWNGRNFYRPAQKPREKTREEIDNEGFTQWFECRDKDKHPHPDYIDVWHAACAYAREASRKGVA